MGEHSDVDAVLAFAAECDVVTFDHEHVPADVLAALDEAGAVMHPSPEALVFAQDKLEMRTRLTALGIPCPRWTSALTVDEVTVTEGVRNIAAAPREIPLDVPSAG